MFNVEGVLSIVSINNVGNWSRLLNSHVLPKSFFKSCLAALELNRLMTDCHNFRWTRTIVAVFIVLWYFCSVCLGGPYEKLLLDSLMKNYNTQNRSQLQKKKYLNHSIFHYKNHCFDMYMFRPVLNESMPIEITFGINLQQIVDLVIALKR